MLSRAIPFVLAIAILSVASLGFSDDLSFKYDEATQSCLNSSGEKGNNKGIVECGAASDVLLNEASDLSKSLAGVLIDGGTIDHRIFFNIDFRGATLKNLTIISSSFSGSNFSGARLENILTLPTDVFTGCNFTNAHINIDVSDARFDNAVFKGAVVTSTYDFASLNGADLRDGDFSGMPQFLALNLKGALFNDGTKMPAGMTKEDAIQRGMIFKN